MSAPIFMRSAIVRAHGGDIEAIRAEIASSTTLELMLKYEKDECGIRRWEQRYGAHARRECRGCKEFKASHEMARTHDGRIAWRCIGCQDENIERMSAYHRARGARRRSLVGEHIEGEMQAIPPVILMSPRLKMSDQEGRWVRWVA